MELLLGLARGLLKLLSLLLPAHERDGFYPVDQSHWSDLSKSHNLLWFDDDDEAGKR